MVLTFPPFEISVVLPLVYWSSTIVTEIIYSRYFIYNSWRSGFMPLPLGLLWPVNANCRKLNSNHRLHFPRRNLSNAWLPRTEKIPQGNKGNRLPTIYGSVHSKRGQNKAENVTMAWIDDAKGLWYSPANLDYRISENVQNIQLSHNLHLASHEKLNSGISNRKTNSSRGKIPKKHHPRRLTLATGIC